MSRPNLTMLELVNALLVTACDYGFNGVMAMAQDSLDHVTVVFGDGNKLRLPCTGRAARSYCTEYSCTRDERVVRLPLHIMSEPVDVIRSQCAEQLLELTP